MVRSHLVSRLLRISALVAMMLTVVFPAMRPGMAAAQGEAQSYTSPLTGQVIQTTGPWIIDTASVDSSPDLEMILLYGEFDGMMVAYLPAGTDLDTARDIFLQEFASVFDSFSQIDRGAYGTVSYSLDIASTDGVEFGVFSLFLGQRASGFVEYYLYFGPVAFFQQGFTSAQANVSVGGNPVFDGVDPAGLQGLLNANAGSTGGSTQAPETNVVQSEVQEDAPAPTQAAQPTQAPQPTDPPQTDSGPASNDGATYIEILESELVYLEVTIAEFLTNFGALQDGGAAAVEEINRVAGEWSTYPEVAASVPVPPGFEAIHADYLALADDVGALGQAWYAVVDALQNNGDVDGALTTFTTLLSGIQTQISGIRTGLAERAATSQPETAPTEAAQPTQPPQPEPTEEDIVDLTDSDQGGDELGNETETGEGGESPNLSALQDLGLVADDMWVSPQHDVEMTWDETWFFDATNPDGIFSDESSGHDSITLLYMDPAGGNTVGLMYLDVVTADGTLPGQLGDVWSSEDYLVENDAELVLADENRSGTSAAVISRESLDDGTELFVLREASCANDACDALILTQLFAESSTFPDVYDAARGGVEADGSRLLGVFSLRDVEDLGT